MAVSGHFGPVQVRSCNQFKKRSCSQPKKVAALLIERIVLCSVVQKLKK